MYPVVFDKSAVNVHIYMYMFSSKTAILFNTTMRHRPKYVPLLYLIKLLFSTETHIFTVELFKLTIKHAHISCYL